MSTGRQTRDGATVRRVQVMLDEETIERAKALGYGNVSIGLRKLAKEAEMKVITYQAPNGETIDLIQARVANTAPASPTNMKVACHPGGLLFAGDERYFPAGWYLFDGEDARPVTVFEPFSNDQIVVGE